MAWFASASEVPLLGGGEHPVGGGIQGETMAFVKGRPVMGEIEVGTLVSGFLTKSRGQLWVHG